MFMVHSKDCVSLCLTSENEEIRPAAQDLKYAEESLKRVQRMIRNEL